MMAYRWNPDAIFPDVSLACDWLAPGKRGNAAGSFHPLEIPQKPVKVLPENPGDKSAEIFAVLQGHYSLEIRLFGENHTQRGNSKYRALFQDQSL